MITAATRKSEHRAGQSLSFPLWVPAPKIASEHMLGFAADAAVVIAGNDEDRHRERRVKGTGVLRRDLRQACR